MSKINRTLMRYIKNKFPYEPKINHMNSVKRYTISHIFQNKDCGLRFRNITFSAFLKRIFVLLLTIIFTAGSLYAEDRGGYAGSFMRMGLGARAKAMGGAFVGMPGDGYSIYYNPAGLPDLTGREAAFSYRNLSLDRKFYYVGIASKLPPSAGLGIGWIHAGVGNIDGRDFTGTHTRTYSDSQNGFLFSFGIKISPSVNIGIGGTIVREDLADINATGFGLSTGIQYKPFNILTLGAAVRDLGAHYSWNSEPLYERGSSFTDKFPTVYTAGASLNIERFNTIVLLDIFKNNKSEAGYRAGIENNYLDRIAIRGGIDDGNLTAGLGIRFSLIQNEGRLDYAIGTSDIDPEVTHIFSFSVKF